MKKKDLLSMMLIVSNLMAITSCKNKDDENFSYQETPYSYEEKVEEGANEEFNEYLREFFADYLADDYYAWNIFTIKPQNFGQNREEYGEPTWYTYVKAEEGEFEQNYKDMQGFYALLTAFDRNSLTHYQQVSYDTIDELFKNELAYYEAGFDPLMELSYIDQFGGYASNFISSMQSYTFWQEQDIKDCLSLIKSLPEAFASYETYCSDKAEAGYPISDTTLTGQITFLNDTLKYDGEFFLIDIFNQKLDDVVYLPQSKKDNYKNQFKQYVNDYMLPSFQNLATNLEKFKGKCRTTGYLTTYGEKGKKLFEYRLRTTLGEYDLSMEDYGAYLEEKLDFYTGKMNSLIETVNVFPTDLARQFSKYENGSSLVTLAEPMEMLDFLKEFAKTIVPDLDTTPEITVKEMYDAEAKATNAVAYYTKSAIDNSASEKITLNPYKLSTDYNETLSTLAHEGYPGHLYAYLYSKQLPLSNIAKVMSNTGHAEGWATYVQYKLYKYLKTHNTCKSTLSTAASVYCDYSCYNEIIGYLLYTYIDYGIHYKGWNKADVAGLLDDLGYNSSIAGEVIDTLIEMPGQYAAYGYGMVYFIDLHDNAKAALGSKYNEIEFNSVLLSDGWVGYDRLEEVVNNYIDSLTK